jgi:hypothetical protein
VVLEVGAEGGLADSEARLEGLAEASAGPHPRQGLQHRPLAVAVDEEEEGVVGGGVDQRLALRPERLEIAERILAGPGALPGGAPQVVERAAPAIPSRNQSGSPWEDQVHGSPERW